VNSREATVSASNLNAYCHILRNTQHAFFPMLATDLLSITLEPSAAAAVVEIRRKKKTSQVLTAVKNEG